VMLAFCHLQGSPIIRIRKLPFHSSVTGYILRKRS
jgi:hypothetical protein